ncbi:matrixin family metalloprotease [Gracilimonas mengyeensis]|uniref:Matrixin n=1 Tax=Gracilimonas mengyeensis TaxID=1302730 RepID=A0A521FNY8_9BACT|nr:matrixin family metalloprotease [Gracilimonas mengyeensis]SMO97181.1 Matrixin [Gracilimonas mengyeensis]
MKFYLLLFVVCLVLGACKNKGTDPNPDDSKTYAACDRLLYEGCPNTTADYCLFGYKWGAGNPLTESGNNSQGPRTSAGIVTYSIQPAGTLFNTHREVNLTSKSFSTLPACALAQIKRALNDWQQVANIEFQEEAEGSNSHIRFILGDVSQSGIGFPNFPAQPCSDIGGDVILSTGNKSIPCEDGIYPLALHEIGHTLGLGHVKGQAIMSTTFWDDEIRHIQRGDSLGLIELYGIRE